MKKNRRSDQKPSSSKNPAAPAQAGGSDSTLLKIILAMIAAIATIIAAYLVATKPVSLTIQATQRAEALHTSIAITNEVFLNRVTETPIPLFTPSGAPTQTNTPAPSDTPSPIPTEAKPVKYEYTVKSNDTLDIISRKFFVSDSYAAAIGRANCNISPVAGDLLVIRYYYVQQGDTLDLIAERFGGSVNFLRSINSLTRDVISPPVGQILILPGDCSGS